MLCEDLGRLLTALPIYVNGVFGDDAIVGKIVSGADCDECDDDVLLCIKIFIRVNGKERRELSKDIRMLEELIYNPSKHGDYMLSRVYIGYDFYE